jgi:DNA-binding CsgD family transcriptional regulator
MAMAIIRLGVRSVQLLMQSQVCASPASMWLEFLNTVVPCEYISLVSYQTDPPHQIEGHAWSVPNITAQCFEMYREHFYAQDEITREARRWQRQPTSDPDLFVRYLRADQLPSADWKRAIYDQHQLADRFSVLYRLPDLCVVALHLYRPASMGALNARELVKLKTLVPLLCQAHQSHHPTGQQAPTPAWLAQLSTREAQACRWLAQGYSAKEVARQLDVAPSTITTLRKRAYAKLGLHSQAQLRDLFLQLS